MSNEETDSSRMAAVLDQLGSLAVDTTSEASALAPIVALGQQALGSLACTFARVNLDNDFLEQVVFAPADSPLGCYMAGRRVALAEALGPGQIAALYAKRNAVLRLYDLQAQDNYVVRSARARQFDFDALLCVPVRVNDQLVGYLNHFAHDATPFTVLQEKLMQVVAQQASLALERLSNEQSRRKLQALNVAMQHIDEAQQIAQIFDLLLRHAAQLMHTDHCWVSRLDPNTGRLHTERTCAEPDLNPPLAYGEGVTGHALKEGAPIRIGDVSAGQWSTIYRAFWHDTRSEMAVPIVITEAEVRVGKTVQRAPKRIGVINVESPLINAFSREDEVILWSLARHAAVVIDRLELEHKLAELGRVEQQIVGQQDWDEIIHTLVSGITGGLGFEYVNVSIVDWDTKTIQTEAVIGLPAGKPQDFIRLARHPLASTDIQSDVMRHREIEVPAALDGRFDKDIYWAFGHNKLIRVFVPMIATSRGTPIGTVEAGYPRESRPHIYEGDVRILKQLVDYAAEALERRRRGLLEEITHEFRAPAVAIRNNASFLEQHWRQLEPSKIARKLADMQSDSEMLLYQVGELESFLGRPPQQPRIERTLVFRDVIIAAINQLKPPLRDRQFDPQRIEYDSADIYRLGSLYIDRSQLKHVVFNLLLNAIKYAEDDPRKFRIRIEVEAEPKWFSINFMDWGIGINAQYLSRIFDTGYRTPEAEARVVSGSGLGLSISRRIMRDLGGDLVLRRTGQPTEFAMLLPKTLQEAPK